MISSLASMAWITGFWLVCARLISFNCAQSTGILGGRTPNTPVTSEFLSGGNGLYRPDNNCPCPPVIDEMARSAGIDVPARQARSLWAQLSAGRITEQYKVYQSTSEELGEEFLKVNIIKEKNIIEPNKLVHTMVSMETGLRHEHMVSHFQFFYWKINNFCFFYIYFLPPWIIWPPIRAAFVYIFHNIMFVWIHDGHGFN